MSIIGRKVNDLFDFSKATVVSSTSYDLPVLEKPAQNDVTENGVVPTVKNARVVARGSHVEETVLGQVVAKVPLPGVGQVDRVTDVVRQRIAPADGSAPFERISIGLSPWNSQDAYVAKGDTIVEHVFMKGSTRVDDTGTLGATQRKTTAMDLRTGRFESRDSPGGEDGER